MDEKMLEEIKKQHVNNYRNSILDIIHNNTNVLVNDDITSLLKTPPLDSMDLLKQKLLNFAKKNKVVLNAASLDEVLKCYRSEVLKCCSKIGNLREDSLSKKVNSFHLSHDADVIRINKKDFIIINREIKKIMKEHLHSSFEKKLINNIDSIFLNNIDNNIKSSLINDFTKYINGIYQKQLLENLDIKILVKDTTLINSVKEQTERYLFTLKNSRLLNDSI